jgi:hypothetical protein
MKILQKSGLYLFLAAPAKQTCYFLFQSPATASSLAFAEFANLPIFVKKYIHRLQLIVFPYICTS